MILRWGELARLGVVGAAMFGALPALAEPAARPAAFAMCSVCHKTGKGEPNTIGPNLFGVGSRKSGTLAGYSYSPAMKGANIAWNRATLIQYIGDPRKIVPGTKMAFAGQKDPKAAAAIADYLLSLK